MYNMSVCYRNHLKSGWHFMSARSPPEPVKRVLAACWLLLHCQRFKDKPSSAVRFDEVRYGSGRMCKHFIGKMGKMNRFSSTSTCNCSNVIWCCSIFGHGQLGFRALPFWKMFCSIQSKQSLFCARKPTGRGANACSLMRHVIGCHFWYANMTSILLGSASLAAWCALLEIAIEQASNEIWSICTVRCLVWMQQISHTSLFCRDLLPQSCSTIPSS